MSSEDVDSRLRSIEKNQALHKAQEEHLTKTVDTIQEELAEFINLARQCELVNETDKKVIALHFRVDKVAQDLAVLHSQHEACMKTGDKDTATLLAIQKDVMSLTLKFDQFNGMRATVEANKSDIEALKTSVNGLNLSKDKTEKFVMGRMGNLFDAGFKILVSCMLGWYVYSNGIRTQQPPIAIAPVPAQVQVHNNPGGPDDDHDNPYKKKLEEHQEQDRRFQIELLEKLKTKGITIPPIPSMP
jgi:hypothetical protein